MLDGSNATTINTNICKLIKGTLFFENKAMSLFEIAQKLKNSFLLEYTPEELYTAIEKSHFDGIESFDDTNDKLSREYCLTFDTLDKMKSKQYDRYFDSIVDAFLKYSQSIIGDASYETVDVKNTITDFIFMAFNEDANTIKQLIKHDIPSIDVEKNNFSTIQKKLINDFLNWNNDEKNQFLFKAVSCGIDYCMLSVKKDSTSFNNIFSGKIFYLDTNIFFRLLGINTVQRQQATQTFIEKCAAAGISVRYTNFTKEEIFSSISHNIAQLEELYKDNKPLNPKLLSMHGYIGDTDGFQYAYYEWAKAQPIGVSNRYLAFAKHIKVKMNEVLSVFTMDIGEPFNRAKTIDDYTQYFEELKECKVKNNKFHNKDTLEVDVNNYMFTRIKNTNTLNQNATGIKYYLISADHTLINWAKSLLPGCTPFVVLPSVWYSLILKYKGRTLNDHKAFTQFLNFRINDNIEINPIKKAALLEVIDLEETPEIKEAILVDIDEKLHNEYSLIDSVEEIVSRSHQTITATLIDEATQKLSIEQEEKLSELYDENKQKIKEEREKGKEESKREIYKRLKGNANKLSFIGARLKYIILIALFWIIPFVIFTIISTLISSFSNADWLKNFSWAFGGLLTMSMNLVKGPTYKKFKEKAGREFHEKKYIDEQCLILELIPDEH